VVLKGFASRLGEQSWEPVTQAERDRARGYFTAALLEGLRGAAPADPATGAIDAAGLSAYVQRVVAERTSGAAPYPQQGSWPGDLAVARSILFGQPAGPAPRPRHVAAIHPPVGHAGSLVVQDETGAIHARWQPGDATPWTALLEPGFYQVRHDPPDPLAAPLPNDGLFSIAGADRDVRL
jgi:hypothetical protein